MSDLRKLDEEIARMRGWERVKRTSGILLPGDAWIAPACDRGWHGARWVDCNGAQVLGYLGHEPPPFSSSWALAGPLLKEMADATEDGFGLVQAYYDPGEHDGKCWYAGPHATSVDELGFPHGEPTARTPCEAIARAWVAWRRGRA